MDFGTDDVGAETTQRACRVYGSFELRLITFLKKKGPFDRISTSFNPMGRSRQLVHTFRQCSFWVEDLSSSDTFQREKTCSRSGCSSTASTFMGGDISSSPKSSFLLIRFSPISPSCSGVYCSDGLVRRCSLKSGHCLKLSLEVDRTGGSATRLSP